MSHESGSTYKGTLGPLSSTGTVHYYSKAQDNAGNARTSSTHAITVQDCDTTTPTPTATPMPQYVPLIWVYRVPPTPTVTVTPTPACDPYEPNNTQDEAWGPLHSGQAYYAKLCRGDSDDFYFFNVSQISPVDIHLRLPNGLVEHVALILYDGNLNPICQALPVNEQDYQRRCNIDRTGRYLARLYPDSGNHYDNQHSYMIEVTYR